MKIKFGQKVVDPVTGFTGIVTGRSEYMWGCVHLLVVPPIDKDGKKMDGEWMDEARVEAVPEVAALPCPAISGGGPATEKEPSKI